MDESQWLICATPTPMLEFLRGKASDRQLRLFACACCRHVWYLVSELICRQAVEVAEGYADGTATQPMLSNACRSAVGVVERVDRNGQSGRARAEALSACIAASELPHSASTVAQFARSAATWDLAEYVPPGTEWNSRTAGEAKSQADIVRDIFGNPFCPVVADPSWLTSTVVSLAQGIYADRAFDRLPILADALEDAGCDNADVLAHCRQPGEHVRGCWAVDLLTDRK